MWFWRLAVLRYFRESNYCFCWWKSILHIIQFPLLNFLPNLEDSWYVVMPVIFHVVRTNSESFKNYPTSPFPYYRWPLNTSFPLVITESNFLGFSLLKWSSDLICVHVKNLLLESPCQDTYCNTRSYTRLQTLIAYLEKHTHTFSEALGVCSEMPRWRAGREQLSPKTQHRGIHLKLKKKVFTCKAFT